MAALRQILSDADTPVRSVISIPTYTPPPKVVTPVKVYTPTPGYKAPVRNADPVKVEPPKVVSIVSIPTYTPTPGYKAPVVYKEPKPVYKAPVKTIDTIKEVTPVKENMTAFGKTIVGKILKVGAIAGGSILGLGAVSGIIRGSGAAVGAVKAVGGVKKVLDKVGQGAVGLITGTTKEERAQVSEVKAEAKAAAEKIEQVNRLVKAGATPEKARLMAGIPETQLEEYEGKTIQTAGIGDIFSNKKVLYILGAVAALFAVFKMIKKR